MPARLRLLGASAGLVGPVAFVGGWLVAGSIRPGYSAVREQISQLARLRLLGASAGLVGPVAFVGGWLVAGSIRPGYSAVREQISQLARLGAPHRALMTAAFIAFGGTVPVFGPVLDESLGAGGAVTGTLSLAGLATLGVAAVPLSRSPGGLEDIAHGALATLGYLGMALTPIAAARALRRRHRVVACVSAAAGVASAASLAATAFVPDYVGLFQRLGLGVVDVWLAAMAISLLLSDGGADEL